ncbi:putative inheritance of peroxisomes protein 1 [[Candida] jaroonii]|uniref:Inheritance of peroxisomes protein 1 n=1 Tax=[Candida] jaroonii TaxID=467808 RepID=A0ACA9Y262_9ASCO|nr:putative inheritance of peroxisomes protein 1 [[Candida] jaroonii]
MNQIDEGKRRRRRRNRKKNDDNRTTSKPVDSITNEKNEVKVEKKISPKTVGESPDILDTKEPDKPLTRTPVNNGGASSSQDEVITNKTIPKSATLSMTPKSELKTKHSNDYDYDNETENDNDRRSDISPRKQTLMRNKQNASNNNTITNAKTNLKPNFSPKSTHVDEKISLFKFKSSRILVFDKYNDLSGRLLSHGEFEIFQLHNGDVTYLSCGSSFIYPLLPKLKILRISSNQFILPLVNPERYWKIFINSSDMKIISKLQMILEKVVEFRNLVLTEQHDGISEFSATETEEIESSVENKREVSGINIDSTLPESPPSVHLSPNFQYSELQSPVKFEFPSLSTQLPTHNTKQGIPPSPSNFHLSEYYGETLPHSTATKNPYNIPISNSSVKSSQSFKFNPNFMNQLPNSNLKLNYNANIPTTLHSSHKKDEDLDSLLDEYEESITQSISQSRISRSSSVRKLNLELEYKTRSRRSSRSELYTSESNWMEPSNVNFEQKVERNDLNSTYKKIYKSINLKDRRLPTIEQSKSLNLKRDNDIYKIIKEEKSFTSRLFGW